MKPKQLVAALDDLDMSLRELADMLGFDVRSVYRWRAGEAEIPPFVDSVIGLLQIGAFTPQAFIKARSIKRP